MKVPFIVVLIFIIYSNSLRNSFVWDDISIVVNNKWIRSLNNFFKFFTLKDTVSEDTRVKPKIYRPFTTFTYAIDYRFWKLNPFGYHLSNLIYHSLTTILVYLLGLLIFKTKEISYISSVLFALHPVHTEAVSWIKGRADILATMFGLGSFYFYIIYTKNIQKYIYLFISFVFFVLALFSKESALSILGIIVLYDFLFNKNLLFKNYIFYIFISFIYIIIRILVVGSFVPGGWWGGSLYYTFLTMTKVFAEYFRLLILPINLCADYIIPISYTFLDLKVIISVLLILIVIVFSLRVMRTYPIVTFFILFIFISLIPVSNIVPIEVLLAERFLYLASVGFCLFLGWALYSFLYKKKVLRFIVITLILLPYGVLTYQRNNDWKDEFSLWQRTLKQMPDNFRAHNNIGMEYEKKGDFEKALYHYNKALTLMPNLSWIYNDKEQVYARVYNNIGNVYMKKGDLNLALQNYQKSLQLDTNYSQPYFNIGLIFRKLNNLELAIKYYKKAIDLNPYIAEYYNNLGVVYALKDDFSTAVYYYNKALELATDKSFKESVGKNIEIAKNYLNKK